MRFGPDLNDPAIKDARYGGLIALSVAAFSILLYRVTKFMVVSWMAEGDTISVLPKIFNITLVFNKGAAFGLFKNANILFIVLSSFVTVFILLAVWKKKIAGPMLPFSLGLILGGAAGNLIDRIIAGHVVDFFDFQIWPVFNIADTAITIGTALLVWYIFAHGHSRES